MAQARLKKASSRASGAQRPAAPRAKGRKSARGGAWAGAKLGLARIFWGLVLGVMLGGTAVAAIAWRAATERVSHRLGQAVWSVPGRIFSGPQELWVGLHADVDALSDDLIAAGYARGGGAPGEFSVNDGVIVVHTRAESGPGYRIAAGKLTIRIAEGRIVSLSSGKSAVLPPATFALVKGADNENRSPVALSATPKHLQDAVLAMEDGRFYQHHGVDPVGLARAMFTNLRAGAWVQGGSTITQQVAKNLFLSAERTAIRKFDELFLALALERELSKDEILSLYLNEIYLGQADGSAVCGMDAAARAYFARPVSKLTLPQSATLAGIISAPNQYSPVRHPETALVRRNLSLDRMVGTGRLSRAEADAARALPLGVEAGPGSRRAPWAMDLALEQAEHELGDGAVVKGALGVYTTLHPQLQRLAERVVTEGAAALEKEWPRLGGVQIALAAVRVEDGAIVALVGGKNYVESPYNRAVLSSRLIGSTVKPLTAFAAFEADPSLSPGTVFDDSPIHRVSAGKDWEPANYDRSFVGPISLRRAMATSRNIPAVLLAERVGMTELARFWKRLGLSGATDWPSAALGSFGATPVELAGAYTAIASGGKVRRPFLTRAVRGAKGESLWEEPAPKADTLSPRAAALTLDVLIEVLETGTGKTAKKYGVGRGAGGKSGTTDDTTDAWFVGVTPELSVAVWVGFDRNTPLRLTGSQAALPIWASFVAGSGTSEQLFSRPAGLVELAVCADTGAPPCPGSSCETQLELFSATHPPACGATPAADAAAGEGVSPEERDSTIRDHWRRIGEILGIKR